MGVLDGGLGFRVPRIPISLLKRLSVQGSSQLRVGRGFCFHCAFGASVQPPIEICFQAFTPKPETLCPNPSLTDHNSISPVLGLHRVHVGHPVIPGGSWVAISEVISPLSKVISIVTLPYSPTYNHP